MQQQQNGFSLTAGALFNTGHRPLAVALDEANNRLYVTAYMGETLDVFDLNNIQAVNNPVATIDLGYANANLPSK